VFTKSAAFYDTIYSFKNYEREAQQLHALIQQHKRSPGMTLLDVACGTGAHIPFLREHYAVEGLDLDANLLAIARQRNPDITFHQADMLDFDLGHSFDVMVCLFSSIGYVKTADKMKQAIQNMSRHAQPGGLVIVEPWLTPDTYRPGMPHALFIDRPELKIARMNLSMVEDGLSVLDFHYLIATSDGVDYFTERHELGLFTHADYLEAFRVSRLNVVHDPEGLMGRGLYIGIRPSVNGS